MNGVTGAASDVASAGAGAIVGPLAQLLGGEQVETLKATLMIAGGAVSFTYLHTIAGPRISRVDLQGKDETKLTTAFNSPSSPSSARSTYSFVEAPPPAQPSSYMHSAQSSAWRYQASISKPSGRTRS